MPGLTSPTIITKDRTVYPLQEAILLWSSVPLVGAAAAQAFPLACPINGPCLYLGPTALTLVAAMSPLLYE